MEVTIAGTSGARAKKVTLDDRAFGIEPNRAVLHQAVVAHLANARQGTADTKTRSEVAASTKKMWRQKGTGHARQGARSAPHWKGGGVVFGPHPHSFHKALPKQMRKLALRSALSDKMASGDVMVVEALAAADGRTKALKTALAGLGAVGKVLVIVPERDEELRRAAGNLDEVFIAEPGQFSVSQIIQAKKVVFVGDAAQRVSDMLLASRRGAAVAPPETPPVTEPEPAAVPAAPRRASRAKAAE